MLDLATHAAAKNVKVAITGESGVGKDVLARYIHAHSPRASKPFVALNCAGIAETLLESELFGHVRGSFTGAYRDKVGCFELAHQGTVFLDEIGDMPLAMQAKILKVIETNRFRRLGGKEDLQANVRIIAATNQDLPAMVRDGRFRGDLLFRLKVMSLPLPPLRERKEDIPKMVDYFIARLNEEYGRCVEGISAEALEDLMRYDWPGNVRELRNAIERAMMLENARLLTAAYLPCEIRQNDPEAGAEKAPAAGRPQPSRIVLPQEGVCLEEVEKDLILQALARHGGNQTKAARCLRMSRDTLRYRMKKFNLGESEEPQGLQPHLPVHLLPFLKVPQCKVTQPMNQIL